MQNSNTMFPTDSSKAFETGFSNSLNNDLHPIEPMDSNQNNKKPDNYYASSDSIPSEKKELDFDKDEQRRDIEISTLARQFTNTSSVSLHTTKSNNSLKPTASSITDISPSINPFIDPANPKLDPHSDDFSARAWARHVLRMRQSDPSTYPTFAAGVAFRSLGAYGFSDGASYQKTVANLFLSIKPMIDRFIGKKSNRATILKEFDGLVKSGETCVVLGRPGAGCSTFLKSIASDTYGFHLTDNSQINYQGISPDEVRKSARSMAIYCAETETHFPKLSVGDTLKFAALARTPHIRFPGVTRDQYATHVRDVVMASFGLLHTMNTFVGNEFIRGVSGGERKRVSISEVVLAGAAVQCWDNSTRGLDSATALEFVKFLKVSADISNASVFVSLYQASQDAYDLFDKVLVLYRGRQIFFGSTKDAKQFFENMGYVCIDRQTTGDFLTSLTSPSERVVKEGYENKVPRTPDEFEAYWKNSPECAKLILEVDEWNARYPLGSGVSQDFEVYKKAQQSKNMPRRSAYYLSYPMQIKICVTRGFQRLRNDYDMALTTVLGHSIAALLVSSIFYNLPQNSHSFYFRSAAIFFSTLFNALSSLLEVFVLYTLRPVAEKHEKYAFHRPSAEAIASLIVDMPTKIVTSLSFNLILYFMVNLRRSPGPFFIFFLFSFVTTQVMCFIFRFIASITKSVEQALTPSSFVVFMLVTTTGFIVPIVNMHPWIRWINYINPIAYAFESLMVNEYRNREFYCAEYIPRGSTYDSVPTEFRVCNVVSAKIGETMISGSKYIIEAFEYYPSHMWRNLGILFVFGVGFFFLYIFFVEYVKGQRSSGEVLIFPLTKMKKMKKALIAGSDDIESQQDPTVQNFGGMSVGENGDNKEIQLQRQEGIFQWRDVCYDIKIKGEPRRLLDHVDGWVQPGTLTALMGPSGAGKTTLLDTLANRVTMGVVTGDMLVNGQLRDTSFQRKTGYVQQQDVHLSTSTVREALEFSALLRQPNSVSRADKLAYVDEVIKILEMEEYADAVVGVPGEGLNVEQRKRLTIGVELVAKPELLLFLDEPTSGLDSQTAWSIMMLMKKLTNNGQAILCTIHQPSAVLFQQFDRLLFLKKGGQTVYYGDIGPQATKLIDYFERSGAPPCPPDANPAEWMLSAIGAAPGSHTDHDWYKIWCESPEYSTMKTEMAQMMEEAKTKYAGNGEADPRMHCTYASPLYKQVGVVSKRSLANTWRDPLYIWSKLLLCILVPFFLGVVFWKADNTIQGMQNQMYSIFSIVILFLPLVEAISNPFVIQRTLYETRERPSRTYSWVVFIISMIISELPWQTLSAITTYFTFYYPAGLYRNASAAGQTAERGALFFLILLLFYYFILTFAYMVVAAIPDAQTAGNIATVLFNICLAMSGVLAPKEALPGFWIFMYRASPFTYLISGLISSGIAHGKVKCSDIEVLRYPTLPNPGMTCGQYLGPFANATGGVVYNPLATSNCEYCSISHTDTYLDIIHTPFSEAWRNFGLIFVYVGFNILAALGIYWLFRVPHPWGHPIDIISGIPKKIKRKFGKKQE